MPADYLHNHKDFAALLDIVAEEKGIQAGLIEKDYWLMHILYGLKLQGFDFNLKGGTSLSKGYNIIYRFSEDIDIYIKPPQALGVNENHKSQKDNAIKSRKDYFDWLANEIKIDGITLVERDHAFDDVAFYRSGGIRLFYKSSKPAIHGVKDGILLEAGFDTVTPANKLTISSWAFDKAHSNPVLEIIDNRAVDVACYHPGYTLVEKLQTIATKFRNEAEGKAGGVNFMRQYYDVYCLLANEQVQAFIGTLEYEAHKQARFPKADLLVPLAENEAFLLNDAAIKSSFIKRYQATQALYYNGQPDFGTLLNRLKENLGRL